jgi:thiamine monophosphate kinase
MEISENKLIRKIRAFEDKSNTVLRGIGDDGAVVQLPAGPYVLVQDAMVELTSQTYFPWVPFPSISWSPSG